jgi:hypothetical protein
MEQAIESKYFISVLTDYVRSLSFYKQTVEHYICKLIIEHLITSNRYRASPSTTHSLRLSQLTRRLCLLGTHLRRYYQLHQFLQYHVIGDSVHVACQLLSLVLGHTHTTHSQLCVGD